MIRNSITHPLLLEALAGAGHGSRILIADGNYPTSTAVNPGAKSVSLNVAPGLVDAETVLRLLVPAIPIEMAAVMTPETAEDPEILAAFKEVLSNDVPIERLDRRAFYEVARSKDLALAIATGEPRLYGNVLLTVGVIPPDANASAVSAIRSPKR